MKTGAAVELVWQLAAREAIAAEYREIEPEHLLAAVLKFAELSLSELENSGAAADLARALRADVEGVRDEFARRAIESTKARHELRAILGKGGCPFPGGTIHRSQACRDLFDAAGKAAVRTGSGTLTPKLILDQILSSPTPREARVLGGPAAGKAPGPSKTPLLDALGRDLARLAAEGKLPAVQDRGAECKALLEGLGGRPQRSVLLISETEEAALAVVIAAALSIAGQNAPLSLHGRRTIALEAPVAEAQAEELLAEAAAAEIILYLPAVDLTPSANGPEPRAPSLLARLKRSGAQCVCRMGPQSYARLVERDKTWKREAATLFVHEARTKRLPREL